MDDQKTQDPTGVTSPASGSSDSCPHTLVGYTYPRWMQNRLIWWLWRHLCCPGGWHLWDEVVSDRDHYLFCDACDDAASLEIGGRVVYPPVVCQGCGCKMATIPPPEWTDAMKPRILCGSCVAGVPVRVIDNINHDDPPESR